MRRKLTTTIAVLSVVACSGWQTQTPPAAQQTPKVDESKPAVKLAVKHLPNAYRIHEKVISGGQPDGEQAFKELSELGVKTVISVDGARPDLAAARKYNLRYVHLPHGYDGVSDDRIKELAKAVRDLPGPIYIHCHYGKHRSPAAASVACVAAGLLERSKAEAVLKTAGTSEAYRGLYASARNAKPLDARLLDELNAEFPEIARLPPMAEAMVALERTHDHIKSIAEAGWKPPSAHPDLAPAHEALLLREHFTELLRNESVRKEPESFKEMIRKSEAAAKDLEEVLKGGVPKGASLQRAKSALAEINRNCTACHRQYRDVPLDEKQRRP